MAIVRSQIGMQLNIITCTMYVTTVHVHIQQPAVGTCSIVSVLPRLLTPLHRALYTRLHLLIMLVCGRHTVHMYCSVFFMNCQWYLVYNPSALAFTDSRGRRRLPCVLLYSKCQLYLQSGGVWYIVRCTSMLYVKICVLYTVAWMFNDICAHLLFLQHISN